MKQLLSILLIGMISSTPVFANTSSDYSLSLTGKSNIIEARHELIKWRGRWRHR